MNHILFIYFDFQLFRKSFRPNDTFTGRAPVTLIYGSDVGRAPVQYMLGAFRVMKSAIFVLWQHYAVNKTRCLIAFLTTPGIIKFEPKTTVFFEISQWHRNQGRLSSRKKPTIK